MRKTFAIVGAGVAGVRAAASLRSAGFDGRLVLIGAEDHLPYDRPPLSKELLLGEQLPTDIRLHGEDFYVDNDIELALGTRVARLLPHERRIVLSTDESLDVDRALLCTGGTPRRLNVPGSDLEGVHYLRVLDDALKIHDQLREACSVVIVGGGFIGAEVAASARQYGCPVTLLELAPAPMAHALGERIGGLYAELHRQRGVDVRTGVGVAEINGPDSVWEVVTTDGQTIPADLVVVGVGILPDTSLAHGAGITVDNGVLVDEYGRTSIDEVYAAGDVANRLDPRTGKHVRREHWQSAQRHAESVARSMVDAGEPFSEVAWFWSDQYGVNLQTAGEPRIHDDPVIRGDVDDLSFVAFSLSGDQVVGAIGVNRPRDLRAAMSLIEHSVHVDTSVLSDISIDLRQLTKRAKQQERAVD